MLYGRACNTIITYYDSPDDWIMKQFFSREDLEKFAAEEQLIIEEKEQK